MEARTITLEPDGWEGTSVVVSGKGGVLGRSAGTSDIVVDLPSISRVHAQLHLEQELLKSIAM